MGTGWETGTGLRSTLVPQCGVAHGCYLKDGNYFILNKAMLFWLSTSTVCEEEMPRFNARETAAPSCVHTGLVSDVNGPSPPALAGPTQPMPSVPALCGHCRTATGVHVSQQDLSLCTKYQHLLTTPCCCGSTRPDSKAPLKPGWRVPVPGAAQPGAGAAPVWLRCGSGVAPAPPSARRAARTRGGTR